MSGEPGDPGREQRLDAVVTAYLEAVEAGQAPDSQEWLDRHADLAAELGEFLAGLNVVRRWTEPLACVAEAARLGPAPAGGAGAAAARGSRFGDYELLAEIGRGGMGVVYRARQVSLNRPVALKMIRGTQLAGAADRARFRTEAELVASLDHPHIVPVYEVGELEGQLYFTMKLLEGNSAAAQVERTRADPRAAARLVAVVARAAHHAHQRGVLHRDLKPQNILLDAEGRPYVTDFGLARRVEVESGLTQSGAPVGTPEYMAPEQAAGTRGAVTIATDVYGLGALLYALLTGRPPFRAASVLETLEQVRTREPVAPRQVRPGVPPDLETVCLKCLHKDPHKRYDSAKALAEDLDRWLAGEPIQARPTGRAERVWRWCQRNWAAASLLGAVITLLLVGVVATTLAAREARAREREAKAREEEANGRARDRQRDSLWQQLQLVRRGTRLDGWSGRARKLTAEVAALGLDARLRDEAAASSAGIDARPREPLGRVEASAVAFDPAGKRLLLGGTSDWQSKRLLEGARLWDGATGELITSQRPGPGPVAFLPDGAAVQLALGKAALLLWDVAGQRPVSECKLDLDPANRPRGLVANALRYPVLALSPAGPLVAAAITRVRQDTVAVWQGKSGKRLFERPRANVSALAFSPRGDLLAIGDKEGHIDLWSVAHGERVTLRPTRTTIHALAFSHDAGHSPQGGTLSGRLAIGDAGGTVTVWDLASQQLIARCHESGFDVFAVAFSPDGMILASGGRGPTRLWDAASGRLLLQLVSGDHVTGLAFSPDGKRLAVSGRTHPFHAGQVFVWDLEFGRGIQTLRGLTAPIARVCFAPDGRRLAALAHTWEVAVWDVEKGHLLRKLEAPQGVTIDHTGLVLSRDGRQLAFSAREEARLWDVGTGQVLGSWKLRPGLTDALAFTPTGKLLAARVERRQRLPDQDWRLRELVRPGTATMIAEKKSFNGLTSSAGAALDGSCFVVRILRGEGRRKGLFAIAFDGHTGARRWSLRLQDELAPGLAMDPEGRLLSIFPWKRRDQGILVDTASGKRLGYLAFGPQALSPGAEYLVLASGGTERGYALLRRGGTRSWAEPVATSRLDG
jgi:WD40 repeat protein